MRGQRTKTNARTRKGKAKTVANKKKVCVQISACAYLVSTQPPGSC